MKPSICFVSLNNYPILAGRTDLQHIGGAEVQQALIGQELAKRGYRVSFVTLDHAQPDGESHNGIVIYKSYQKDDGYPILRFFHPRWSKLWSAMTKANADIYYHRGAEAETGIVANWCRTHNRKFVFAVAHDTNCDPAFPALSGRLERNLYRYGLYHADAIIAQTNWQSEMLQHGFGLPSFVIGNCCTLSDSGADRVTGDTVPATHILWVGRLSPEKRPEWLIKLACEVPERVFEVVGSCNADSLYGRKISSELDALPNVIYHTYVRHEDMLDLYRKAALLLSTSISEGFPNVFLEAWMTATPVLTTLDPDGLIGLNDIGVVVQTFEKLKLELKSLHDTQDCWLERGCRALQYVRQHYSVDVSVDALEHVFIGVMRGSTAEQSSRGDT